MKKSDLNTFISALNNKGTTPSWTELAMISVDSTDSDRSEVIGKAIDLYSGKDLEVVFKYDTPAGAMALAKLYRCAGQTDTLDSLDSKELLKSENFTVLSNVRCVAVSEGVYRVLCDDSVAVPDSPVKKKKRKRSTKAEKAENEQSGKETEPKPKPSESKEKDTDPGAMKSTEDFVKVLEWAKNVKELYEDVKDCKDIASVTKAINEAGWTWGSSEVEGDPITKECLDLLGITPYEDEKDSDQVDLFE